MNRNLPTIIAAGLLLLAADAGLADAVHYGTRSFTNIRIIDLREGNLLFETSGGVEQSVPADVIDSLELDDHPQLAEAQTALDEERFDEAAGLLRQVYQAVDADHLKTLVLGQLVNALDQAGQAEQAVQRYLELIERDRSPFVKAAMPANLPEDEAQREALIEPIEARAEEVSNSAARQLLEELLKRLRGESSAESKSMSARAQEDPIAALLDQGKAEQALKEIEEILQEPGAPLSKLLYQRGLARAQLGRHKDAALSFMRVIVHFRPGTTNQYVPSLIEAGRAFQKMGETRHARSVWEEAQNLATDESEQAKQLKELLGSLDSQ